MIHLKHLEGQSLVLKEEILQGSVSRPKMLYKPSPRLLERNLRQNRTKLPNFEIGSKSLAGQSPPIRVEYALTGPGRDLIPVMFAMTKF